MFREALTRRCRGQRSGPAVVNAVLRNYFEAFRQSKDRTNTAFIAGATTTGRIFGGLNRKESGGDFRRRRKIPSLSTTVRQQSLQMLAVIEFDLKTLSSWLGLVGGSIGLIGGAISLYDRWKSNRPRLRFFVTHPFVGMNVNVDRATKFFSVWLRIANLSKQSAFLYLDTILVELRKGTSWYRAPWMEVDPKEVPTTDFPLDPQIRLGLRKPAYLSTFGDNLISYDRPLCGRVVVGLPEGIKDLHEIEGVRITVEDSHRIKYCEKIDLTKEREQHDPRYQTGPKIVSDNS